MLAAALAVLTGLQLAARRFLQHRKCCLERSCCGCERCHGAHLLRGGLRQHASQPADDPGHHAVNATATRQMAASTSPSPVNVSTYLGCPAASLDDLQRQGGRYRGDAPLTDVSNNRSLMSGCLTRLEWLQEALTSPERLLKTNHSFSVYNRRLSWRCDADQTLEGIGCLLHLCVDVSVWLWNHLLDAMFDPAHHAVNHTNTPSRTGSGAWRRSGGR